MNAEELQDARNEVIAQITGIDESKIVDMIKIASARLSKSEMKSMLEESSRDLRQRLGYAAVIAAESDDIGRDIDMEFIGKICTSFGMTVSRCIILGECVKNGSGAVLYRRAIEKIAGPWDDQKLTEEYAEWVMEDVNYEGMLAQEEQMAVDSLGAEMDDTIKWYGTLLGGDDMYILLKTGIIGNFVDSVRNAKESEEGGEDD